MMANSKLSLPIQSRVDINGIPTNLLCQEFADKYLIVVTQYRKLGTLTLVTEDAALPNPDNVKTFTVQVLLGADDNITQVVARCCAQTCTVKKPVLIAAALKDRSKEMVNAVCQELTKLQKTSQETASAAAS